MNANNGCRGVCPAVLAPSVAVVKARHAGSIQLAPHPDLSIPPFCRWPDIVRTVERFRRPSRGKSRRCVHGLRESQREGSGGGSRIRTALAVYVEIAIIGKEVGHGEVAGLSSGLYFHARQTASPQAVHTAAQAGVTGGLADRAGGPCGR